MELVHSSSERIRVHKGQDQLLAYQEILSLQRYKYIHAAQDYQPPNLKNLGKSEKHQNKANL